MDIEEVKKHGYIIHCATESEANRIIKLAKIHFHNFSYSNYNKETCINVLKTKYGDLEYYKSIDKVIISSTTIIGEPEFNIKLNLI